MTGRKKIPLFNLANTEEVGDGHGQPNDLWSQGPDLEWDDPTFEEVARRLDFQEKVYRSIPWEVLTEKQAFVLRASWGIDGGAGYSFYEIAEAMGISASAVNRIYGRAMATLRREAAGGLSNSP